jgi:ankyrin repeat protein
MNCTICRDTGSTALLSRINCPQSHTFHKSCLIPWLKESFSRETFNHRLHQRIQNIWDDTRSVGRSFPLANSFPVRQIRERILRPLSFCWQYPFAYYQTVNQKAECIECRNPYSHIDEEPVPQFKLVDREDFLKKVRNGKLPDLQAALNEGLLSKALLKEAISLAIELNKPEVISLFSQNSPIPTHIQENALQDAFNKDKKKPFLILLNNGPISDLKRERFLSSAVYNGEIEIVRALLTNGPISQENRGEAVKNALLFGRMEIVRALLENGPISENQRGEAVHKALVWGHTEIIKALLANGSITEEHRGIAVQEAATQGLQEIVKDLLSHGSISKKHRSTAYVFAHIKNYTKIAKILLDNGAVSTKAKLFCLVCKTIKTVWNQRYHLAAFGLAWIAKRYSSTETNPEGNDNL